MSKLNKLDRKTLSRLFFANRDKESQSIFDALRSRLPRAKPPPVPANFRPSRGRYSSPDAFLRARVQGQIELNRAYNRTRPRHQHRPTSFRKVRKLMKDHAA